MRNIGLAAVLLLSAATGALSETRALVVGINHYAQVTGLTGAVADADDVAGALKRRGVKDLVHIDERDASRANLLKQLDGIVDRTRKEDLIIISFAGHGVQEVWGSQRPAGIAAGTVHQSYALRDLKTPDRKGMVDLSHGGSAGERIADIELFQYFKAINDKGARLIFVADTCFSGGLYKRAEVAVGDPLVYRGALPSMTFAEGQDPLASRLASLPKPPDVDDVLGNTEFLAAVSGKVSSPEVPIPPGTKSARGALSFAFARIIDGEANTGTPNVLRRGEMHDFIRQTVKTYAMNRQDPDYRPTANPETIAIDFARDFPSEQSAPDEKISPIVKIAVVGGNAPIASSAPGQIPEIQIVGTIDEADLIYDVAAHHLISRTKDIVAADLKPEDIPHAAEREVALRRLLKLARGSGADLTLAAGDGVHRKGKTLVVEVGEKEVAKRPYYMLLLLTGDGTVQFLYPMAERKDSLKLPADMKLADIEIAEPFGADMLVMVTAPTPILPLVADLRALDGKHAALDAVDRIEKALTADMRIGLQGIYSGP